MTEEGSFQFILCARWRSEYYVILGLQFPKDKPCVVSISKPFSAVMNVSPPPALVCMQIAGLIKLTKGPALLNGDMEPALCLPADSKSISPLELAAFSWFCVYNQGPFPGKHSNMSNRWRALFPKDDCSNPIILGYFEGDRLYSNIQWRSVSCQEKDGVISLVGSSLEHRAAHGITCSGPQRQAHPCIPLFPMLSQEFVTFCHLSP